MVAPRTESSTWGKWNPFVPRVNNLDLAIKIISSCSKRKIHCWEIIHLTPKINFLPQEQYIWFQTIFVLRQEDFHKRIFLLPIMDHFSACPWSDNWTGNLGSVGSRLSRRIFFTWIIHFYSLYRIEVDQQYIYKWNKCKGLNVINVNFTFTSKIQTRFAFLFFGLWIYFFSMVSF